ncbi:MAG TPA: gluconate 2-dehydrogenase subunit 3 family protein, partial [Myxococcaceae bacterium]|nr:gluconate 2-dehydrogenase subunit 3 family protein [Myxococcaceae bacterium]
RKADPSLRAPPARFYLRKADPSLRAPPARFARDDNRWRPYGMERSERLERFRAENFLELSRADRETFVRSVGRQAWFEPVRALALGAYFSSETGMTQALRYVLVPGKYVGCMPLEPGQPAWGLN